MIAIALALVLGLLVGWIVGFFCACGIVGKAIAQTLKEVGLSPTRRP